MEKLIINTDGGARGNPGPAAIGAVLVSPEVGFKQQLGQYIGETTNNVAEYKALLMALKRAQELKVQAVSVNMDSELVVKQLTGLYKIKEPTLQGLAAEAKKYLSSFVSAELKHVRRESNKEADVLVNRILDEVQGGNLSAAIDE